MKTKKTIVGQKKIMNNGMECEVIEDSGCNDITVRFEDGFISEHKTRQSFRKGCIGNPNAKGVNNKKTIVGQSKMMNCGMACTVIRDCGAFDIDVQFDDGVVVEHRFRSAFRSGQIANPNLGKQHTKTKNTSIKDQTLTMNCGMKCTVIEDRGSTDIDVQFEDGTIVSSITRTLFRERTVANPTLGKGRALSNKTSIIGQSRTMNCGMECTVIEDRGARDITVQFTDGAVVKSKRDRFLIGRIKNPGYDPTSIIGQEKRMNCGQLCKVIDDNGSEDITVQFEDGYVKHHCARANFFKRKINNPNIATSQSLPQTLIFHFVKSVFPDAIPNYRPDWLKNDRTGQNFEIDVWIPQKRVGIEYDGARWHQEETSESLKKYELIKESGNIEKLFTVLERGAIIHESDKHINYQMDYISNDKEYPELLKQLEIIIRRIISVLGHDCSVEITQGLLDEVYIEPKKRIKKDRMGQTMDRKFLKSDECSLLGMTNEMKCGMLCTVIEDNGFDDITVQFEDETIVEFLRRSTFIKGIINNPNIDNTQPIKGSIVGISKMMNCGMVCEVIEDYGYDDISVRFEDGTILRHKTRLSFRKGSIRNPSKKNAPRPNKTLIGQSRMMNCGMVCTVIGDRGAFDIDVQFEDGTIVEHRYRSAFRSGAIANYKLGKYYTVKRNTSLMGESKTMNCGMDCVVIRDNGSQDITVQFEDGTVVEHRDRHSFRVGEIVNPSLDPRKMKKSIVGHVQTMKNGMECEVIEDKGYKSITVRFEDGTIVRSRRDAFAQGLIRNPNYDPTSILGMKLKMRNGEMATVIEDNGNDNITVQFEDGTIVRHKARANFIKGKVGKNTKETIT